MSPTADRMDVPASTTFEQVLKQSQALALKQNEALAEADQTAARNTLGKCPRTFILRANAL
jgi:hypothetical protein